MSGFDGDIQAALDRERAKRERVQEAADGYTAGRQNQATALDALLRRFRHAMRGVPQVSVVQTVGHTERGKGGRVKRFGNSTRTEVITSGWPVLEGRWMSGTEATYNQPEGPRWRKVIIIGDEHLYEAQEFEGQDDLRGKPLPPSAEELEEGRRAEEERRARIAAMSPRQRERLRQREEDEVMYPSDWRSGDSASGRGLLEPTSFLAAAPVPDHERPTRASTNPHTGAVEHLPAAPSAQQCFDAWVARLDRIASGHGRSL